MTSGGRESLKWLAVILMTGDHVAKVIYGGYVPGLSEAGRVAFPLFALVMAYNLAQPGANVVKSVRRLAAWGSVAQPVHALAFGCWLPLNILLTFALCAAAVYAMSQRRWVVLSFAAVVLPAFVDYHWAGVSFVLMAWAGFRSGRPLLVLAGFVPLCLFNGNLWALVALPLVAALSGLRWQLPRRRWAFYGYYVGHLAVLSAVVAFAGSFNA
ncbi:TraX family protein [Stenotrophomonas maltophilia]|uniref:TraX family protein n=1 Tax=Stenotrophomonas maltophilia TaxID=40324 RepID=UPI0024478156|nr:TraX family protein [Stenotrophomonas maltophilia]MDH0071442.1 TraX family protein [Stenotrophomonas maltophilia]MDH0104256.1 TraX family protein [Stenotrophomonas maltophilia]MDH0330047.1 TraX family protein [Stenotrophomonas maltophilia]MDH0631682.1 TraX family protein [Stenotrophomonas maltophilia]MDH0641067.1 TraX family protein [Stenotrophomonas maltophilia]